MNVREIMTKEVVTISPAMDVRGVAELFIAKDIGGAPVVDDAGNMKGIVLEESLILQDKRIHLPTFVYILNGVFAVGQERFEEELKKMAAITAEGIMEKKFVVLSPDTPVENVATMVVEQGLHYFPVTENGKLVGVVTKKDIVRAIAQKRI